MDIDLVTGPGQVSEDKKSKTEDKEFYRNEKLKDHLHKILTIFIYIAFSFLMLVFTVRLTHIVVPANWQWLMEDQVHSIDKIFFSGAIGSMLGGYFKDKVIRP
jgi:hypothetical protein